MELSIPEPKKNQPEAPIVGAALDQVRAMVLQHVDSQLDVRVRYLYERQGRLRTRSRTVSREAPSIPLPLESGKLGTPWQAPPRTNKTSHAELIDRSLVFSTQELRTRAAEQLKWQQKFGSGPVGSSKPPPQPRGAWDPPVWLVRPKTRINYRRNESVVVAPDRRSDRSSPRFADRRPASTSALRAPSHRQAPAVTPPPAMPPRPQRPDSAPSPTFRELPSRPSSGARARTRPSSAARVPVIDRRPLYDANHCRVVRLAFAQ